MKKFKIVSIIAYDRSGTTFLGKLLNGYKKAFYVGEIDRGIKKLQGKNVMCSCGSKINDCEIWKKICNKPDFQESKDKNKKIYDWIANETGYSVIIDTSKSFKQIKAANSYLGKDQIIVHVIRNPKGVIYSRMKTRKRRVLKKNHPKPYIARHTNFMMIFDALEWCGENIWFEWFKKRKKNVIKIFYEDLDTDFKEKIIPFLEETTEMNANMIENKNKISHVLFGNINRYQQNKDIQIDTQWKAGLNIFQKFIVDFITFPVRILYNYNFNTKL